MKQFIYFKPKKKPTYCIYILLKQCALQTRYILSKSSMYLGHFANYFLSRFPMWLHGIFKVMIEMPYSSFRIFSSSFHHTAQPTQTLVCMSFQNLLPSLEISRNDIFRAEHVFHNLSGSFSRHPCFCSKTNRETATKYFTVM